MDAKCDHPVDEILNSTCALCGEYIFHDPPDKAPAVREELDEEVI